MKLKRRVGKFLVMGLITYLLDPQLGAQRRRDLRRQIDRWQASFAEQRARRQRTPATGSADAPVRLDVTEPSGVAGHTRVEPPIAVAADMPAVRAL